MKGKRNGIYINMYKNVAKCQQRFFDIKHKFKGHCLIKKSSPMVATLQIDAWIGMKKREECNKCRKLATCSNTLRKQKICWQFVERK